MHAEGHEEVQRLVSTSTVPCERCTRDDPPELESRMVALSFLLLTAGPSLTYLCFSLSVEYFVQVRRCNHRHHSRGATRST